MKQPSITIRVSDIRMSYLYDIHPTEYICWSIMRPVHEISGEFDEVIHKITAGVKKACFRYLKGIKHANGTSLLKNQSEYMCQSLTSWLNFNDEMFEDVEVPEWMANKYHGDSLTDRKLRIYVLDKILKVDPDAVVEIEGFDHGDQEWCHFVKLGYEPIMAEVPGFTVKIQDVLAHYVKQTDTSFICTSMINFDFDYSNNLDQLQNAISASMKEKVFAELDGLVYPGTSTPILKRDPHLNNLSVLSAWVNYLPTKLYNSILDAWMVESEEFVDPLRIFVLNKFLELNSDSVLHVPGFKIPEGINLADVLHIPFQVK